MKSLRALLGDLLHAAALIAFTVAADALTRPPEPQLGLPGEDLIEPADDLFDVARAVGGTSPLYDGLLAEEFAREIDFRLDDVVREWSADV
jgi:hypothetical protein